MNTSMDIQNKENFLEKTWQWSPNQAALFPCKKRSKINIHGAAALKILIWNAWSSHVKLINLDWTITGA